MPLALTAGPYHWPILPAHRPPIGLDPLAAALYLPRSPSPPPPLPSPPQVRRHQPGAQRARVRLHPAHGQGGGQGAVLPPDAQAHRRAWPQGGRLRGLPLACPSVSGGEGRGRGLDCVAGCTAIELQCREVGCSRGGVQNHTAYRKRGAGEGHVVCVFALHARAGGRLTVQGQPLSLYNFT